jgi:hypothetical protein
MVAEVQRITGNVDKEVRRTAPRTRGNAYRDNVKAYIQSDKSEGIRGLVVASRHEMVIEFGWTDLAGRWHPGQYIMSNALRKQATGRAGTGAVEPKPGNRSLTRGPDYARSNPGRL